MLTIQALRRSRGITLIDLALLSGVPARTIASIECGLHRLDHRTREQIAHVFGVPAHELEPGAPPALQAAVRRRMAAEARMVAPVVGAALATAVALAPALQSYRAWQAELALPAAPQKAEVQAPTLQTLASTAAPTPAPVTGLAQDAPSAAALALALPTAAPAPSPQPADGTLVSVISSKAALGQGGVMRIPLAAAADGSPAGCPVLTSARVVVTQGYDEGTHAPADVWGALDLGVDRDGDGVAEPESSRGALVFTPHAGTVRVVLESWPGGNYVRVTGAGGAWATAYAHLDQVFVQNGQAVAAGTVIGTVGTTGYSTGPHLHYEVWRAGVNVDPSPFVRC